MLQFILWNLSFARFCLKMLRIEYIILADIFIIRWQIVSKYILHGLLAPQNQWEWLRARVWEYRGVSKRGMTSTGERSSGRRRSFRPVERHWCRHRLTPASVAHAAWFVSQLEVATFDLATVCLPSSCREMPIAAGGSQSHGHPACPRPLDCLGLLSAPGRFNYRTSGSVLSHHCA